MNAFGFKIKNSMVQEPLLRTKCRIFFPNEGFYFPKKGLEGEGDSI
jgi:hypothetical protein